MNSGWSGVALFHHYTKGQVVLVPILEYLLHHITYTILGYRLTISTVEIIVIALLPPQYIYICGVVGIMSPLVDHWQ